MPLILGTRCSAFRTIHGGRLRRQWAAISNHNPSIDINMHTTQISDSHWSSINPLLSLRSVESLQPLHLSPGYHLVIYGLAGHDEEEEDVIISLSPLCVCHPCLFVKLNLVSSTPYRTPHLPLSPCAFFRTMNPLSCGCRRLWREKKAQKIPPRP